jgi:protein subunit release factor B
VCNAPVTPRWHLLSDEALLAQCRVEVHRSGGPGGQHRNKVETAVRLRHLPSGVLAIAKDERSRAQNLSRALARLREKLLRRARKPKPRKATLPSRASVARRLDAKRRTADRKRARKVDEP